MIGFLKTLGEVGGGDKSEFKGNFLWGRGSGISLGENLGRVEELFLLVWLAGD